VFSEFYYFFSFSGHFTCPQGVITLLATLIVSHNIDFRYLLIYLDPFCQKKGTQESQKAFANPERPERN